jgi:hypothetical protein
MPKILRRLKINEVSSVDRGAGEGVHIVLMKKDETSPYTDIEQGDLDDATLDYLKREFSAEQRRSAAESGAALPDGSFPIHNKSDLHNAMQAIGRAKDPAKAKAHIRRRAKTLGLSGELSDAFKRSTWSEFFADLFTREPEPDVAESFSGALAGLAESVKSIMDDTGEADKHDMLAKTFTQFHEHVSPLLGQAPVRQPTVKGDTIMTAQLKKALGLNEDASEEDALKAIAALAEKARRREENGDEEDEEEEEEEEDKKKRRGKGRDKDKEEEEEEEKMLKLRRTLPAALQKQIAEGQEAMKRVKKLEDEATLASFTKRAVESGLPASEGETLQKLFAAAPKEAEQLLKLTVAGFAAAKEAGVFKEFGSTGLNGGGTAFDQLTALAQKYLKDHSGENITSEQAFAKVYADPANKQLRIQEARESGRQ